MIQDGKSHVVQTDLYRNPDLRHVTDLHVDSCFQCVCVALPTASFSYLSVYTPYLAARTSTQTLSNPHRAKRCVHKRFFRSIWPTVLSPEIKSAIGGKGNGNPAYCSGELFRVHKYRLLVVCSTPVRPLSSLRSKDQLLKPVIGR